MNYSQLSSRASRNALPEFLYIQIEQMELESKSKSMAKVAENQIREFQANFPKRFSEMNTRF